jgi:hypothetical protein
MEVEFYTDKDGLALIRDRDLPLTDKELKRYRVSRDDVERIFTQAAKLMEGHSASDRLRPCASETLDGEWVVELVGYSPISDPLMKDIDMKKRN